MDPWNIRQSDGTIVWRHMAATLDFKMADTDGIVGHLEIQYGGHVTSNNGTIWLATPENLGRYSLLNYLCICIRTKVMGKKVGCLDYTPQAVPKKMSTPNPTFPRF